MIWKLVGDFHYYRFGNLTGNRPAIVGQTGCRSRLSAAEVDVVLAQSIPAGKVTPAADNASCACSSPLPGGTIMLGGTTVSITGLPLIFEQCAERDVPADASGSQALFEVVKIYHPIPADEEPAYLEALLAAYQQFRGDL